MAETDRWDDDCLALLTFLYAFWSRERRPPNLADVHAGTGFSRRDVRRLYRRLQAGFAVVVDDERVNLSLLKAPPFSATPTPVAGYVDGGFLSYLGCPAEAVSASNLPPLADATLTVRSACACCFAPIELDLHRMEVVRADPHEPVVVAVTPPWEWEEGVRSDHVCDAFHYVLDRYHGERFAAELARRPVFLELWQMREMARGAGEGRMRDRDWPPIRIDARRTIEGLTALGVDTSPWR